MNAQREAECDKAIRNGMMHGDTGEGRGAKEGSGCLERKDGVKERWHRGGLGKVRGGGGGGGGPTGRRWRGGRGEQVGGEERESGCRWGSWGGGEEGVVVVVGGR